MPQGAEYLATISAFVIAAYAPLLRDLTLPILFKCPGAALLLFFGTFIYQANQRVDLFIVAIAGVLAIVLVYWPDLFPREAMPTGEETLTNLFASPRLRLGVTFGAIVLYLGFLAYPLLQDKIQHWHGDAGDANGWPVLALPAYYSGGDRSKEEKLEFQWKLFSTTQSHLRPIFKPLGEKLTIEPRLNDLDKFAEFSDRFSVSEDNWILLRRELKKYRSENCEKSRLVLHADFQEKRNDGEAEVRIGDIAYRFLRCKPPGEDDDLPRLSFVHDEPIRSLVHEEQLDIVALKVSVPIIGHLLREVELPKPETDLLWQRVTDSFGRYYDDFGGESVRQKGGWRGHELAKNDGCANVSGRQCAEAWKEAYEDISRYKAEQVMDTAIPEVSVAGLLIKTTKAGKRTK